MPDTYWDKTKQYSNTVYEKALKPGFEKTYNVVNKLENPVNKLTYKVGSESFWPGSLDKESEKAARILRSFCKDGFYEDIEADIAQKAADNLKDPNANVPKGKQRVVVKIPAKVIQNAKGLAIFTCMRTGWVIGGSGGAGVLVGRHPDTGEWSPPSGIHMQNLSVGFLGGVDLLDTVLVINNYEALEAFTKLRCTLGTEVGLAAGPVGIGGTIDTQINKMPSPVWSYVKSRGLYGGIGVDGNVVIERTDENERFYGERVGVAKILRGEVRYPPYEKYKVLADTIRAAQGENVDDSLLPDGVAPSDMNIEPEGELRFYYMAELTIVGPIFGIPSEDDPDPFGFKALEAEGLIIREAGTHRKATPDSFEFRPSPSSPVFNTYRKSIDHSLKKKEWRGSVTSVASVNSVDRGTQTEDDGSTSPGKEMTIVQTSMLKDIERTESPTEDEKHEHKIIISEHDDNHKKSEDDSDDEHDDYSDIDSDVEISTAMPVTARPKAGVVNVPKRIPPPLPSRNPDRLSTRSPLAEEPVINGFEDVSLEGGQTNGQSTETKTNGMNGSVHDQTTGHQNTEDEFHSVPPSPLH